MIGDSERGDNERIVVLIKSYIETFVIRPRIRFPP
jgi:hypothetical protein